MERDAFGDERFDVCWQIGRGVRPSFASELSEREGTGDSTPDALRAVAMVDEPREVRVDLRGDPRTTDPIDRRRLDEVLLQHGQLPLSR